MIVRPEPFISDRAVGKCFGMVTLGAAGPTEILARRNLFAHANGIVNDEYKRLVPKSSSSVGDEPTVEYAYWCEHPS
jgi:hypothetical protein